MLWLTASLSILTVVAVGGFRSDPSVATAQERPISPEVLQAIRLLLSEDPDTQSRGAAILRKMGAAAVPQLRYWVHKVREESNRVARVLGDLGGTEAPLPSAERLSASAFFDQKLVECRNLLRDGRFMEAQQIAEAILLLDPSHPCAWELRRLVTQAKQRLVSTQILQPSVESGQLVYEVGDKPEIVFRITNRDRKVARIQLDKGVLGEIFLTVTQRKLDGNMKRDSRQLRIEVPRDVEQILVGPALTWEHPLKLDIGGDIPLTGVVTRVEIGGRFRPSRWTVDRESHDNLTLTMTPIDFWIVPQGLGGSYARPLENLAAAIFFGKPEAFFVSGQIAVWIGEDDSFFNESVVDLLITNLGDLPPPCVQISSRLLAQATGQQFGANVEEWKTWWSETKARTKALQATRETPKK